MNNKESFNEYKKIFKNLLDTCYNIFKNTTNFPHTEIQKENRDFLRRTIHIGYSLYNIYNPQSFITFPSVKEDEEIYDYISAYILVRAIFELYINTYYLFIDPKADKEEKELRLDLWHRHAIKETKTMHGLLNKKNDLEGYEKLFNEFTKKIENSDYYKNLISTNERILKLIENWGMTKNTEERCELAGINSDRAKFMYQHLSNYTHSLSMSIVPRYEKYPVELIDSIKDASMFLSLLLDCFCKILPKAQELIEGQEDIKNTIRYYQKFKGMNYQDVKEAIRKLNIK